MIAGNLLIGWKIISLHFELHELPSEEIHVLSTPFYITVLYIIINIINLHISPVTFQAMTEKTTHICII